MHLCADLHQLLQVNDLVIAPVADIRPGIARLGNLPIDPVVGDAVGVVAIDGGGIQEGADHALDIFGVRIGQRFPVLEDIAPVALVIQLLRAVRLLDVDRKAVPRPAGVAVPAAEGQRQVGVAQADQVGRAVGLRRLCSSVKSMRGGRAAKKSAFARRTGRLRTATRSANDWVSIQYWSAKMPPRITLNITLAKWWAEHDWLLESCTPSALATIFHRLTGWRRYRLRVPGPGPPGRLQPLALLGDRGAILLDIGQQMPAPFLAAGQIERCMDKIRAAPAAHLRFGLDPLARAEPIELHRGEQILRLGQSNLGHGSSQERLAGFGQVGQGRVQGEDGQPGLQVQLAALVSIQQSAEDLLGRDRHVGGQDVLNSVQQLHLAG